MQVNDLIDIHTGERKYLDRTERQAFKEAAQFMPPDIRTFCLMIYYTGCRLNEALEVTPERLDFDGRRVLLRTLKQNPDKPDKYRLVELPNTYLASLESQYQARSRKGSRSGKKRIWGLPIVRDRIISSASWPQLILMEKRRPAVGCVIPWA